MLGTEMVELKRDFVAIQNTIDFHNANADLINDINE